MKFSEEMELLRMERRIDLTKSRDILDMRYRQRIEWLDNALKYERVTGDDYEDFKARATLQYDMDHAEIEAALAALDL